MKKLLILFAFISYMSYSQNPVKILNSNEWLYEYEGLTIDTLGNGDSVWYKEVYMPYHGDAVKYKIYMDVDTVGGTSSSSNKYLFILQAKNSTDESYTALDTVGYIGTADTTFSFTETSTAQLYKRWRMYVKGLSDDLYIEIQKLNWGFYK
jgi:hypothetical protein